MRRTCCPLLSVMLSTSDASASISPTRSDVRRTGVSSRRSKYPPLMSSTSDEARETPVTAKMMAVGSWNAL